MTSKTLKTIQERNLYSQGRAQKITDKHSNESWNWFIKSSTPEALSPVLETSGTVTDSPWVSEDVVVQFGDRIFSPPSCAPVKSRCHFKGIFRHSFLPIIVQKV